MCQPPKYGLSKSPVAFQSNFIFPSGRRVISGFDKFIAEVVIHRLSVGPYSQAGEL